MARYTATWRDSEDPSETIWGEVEARSLPAATGMVADQFPPPWELVSVQEHEYAYEQEFGMPTGIFLRREHISRIN